MRLLLISRNWFLIGCLTRLLLCYVASNLTFVYILKRILNVVKYFWRLRMDSNIILILNSSLLIIHLILRIGIATAAAISCGSLLLHLDIDLRLHLLLLLLRLWLRLRLLLLLLLNFLDLFNLFILRHSYLIFFLEGLCICSILHQLIFSKCISYFTITTILL